MECILEEGVLFKHIVDAIKDLSHEANLDFTEKGLCVQSMDSAHISLCSMLMRTGLFKKFQCPEPISLGINLRTLAMVLNGIHGELRMKSDGNKLQLRVVKLDGIADYTLNLMDIDCENLGLPDTEYQCTCILPSNTFGKVVKDLHNFSDTCSLKINQDLCLSVAGDLGNVSWKSGDDCKCSILSEIDAIVLSVRYLCFFSKASSISNKVIISVSQDMPICLTYPIKDQGYLRFYLAPKMNE